MGRTNYKKYAVDAVNAFVIVCHGFVKHHIGWIITSKSCLAVVSHWTMNPLAKKDNSIHVQTVVNLMIAKIFRYQHKYLNKPKMALQQVSGKKEDEAKAMLENTFNRTKMNAFPFLLGFVKERKQQMMKCANKHFCNKSGDGMSICK